MGPVWIVVADSNHARIYAQPGRGAPLTLVEDIEHEDAAKPASELKTDTPGRRAEANRGASFGGGPRLPAAHGGTVPTTDPEEVELDRYARHVAARLDLGRAQSAFTELVFFMPPRPYGRVKKALDEKTRERIALVRSEDILHMGDRVIAERLRDAWFVPAQPFA